MRSYVVRQGDHLAKIAAQFGVSTDAIWEMPQNREIKEKRDPNILAPGDVLRIPPRAAAGKRYSANRDNSYRAAMPTVQLKVVFSNRGVALKNESYDVFGSGRIVQGQTDENGYAVIQVDVNVDAVDVRFAAQGLSFTLRIGELDPVETELGVAQRLAHLRHLFIPPGATGPWLRTRLRRAVVSFQRAEGLPETGRVDQDTRSRLAERVRY